VQILRVLVVLLAACSTDGRVDALTRDVVPELQRRIGDLEARVAGLPAPAWWCTADRCARDRVDGAELHVIAWCPRGDGPCAPTIAACGAGCVGVR
jgi:hypothetical protein